MKLNIGLIFWMLILISCNSKELNKNAIDQKLELSLVGDNTTFEMGQVIELKLSINNLDGQLVQQSDKSKMIIELSGFEKRISVICKNIGKHSFGPYKINLNNKIVQSNQVSVNIVKPSITNGEMDTVISLAVPEVISNGEKFSIILKSNILLNSLSQEGNINSLDDFSQLKGKTIEVRNNSKIELLNSSYSSSVSVKDENSKSEYIYTFEMLANNTGVVEVNHLFFEPQLPITLKTKTVEIK